ncbi:hypothetical protein C7H19_24585 [Aphanothece hegewaldii CCALA 016]|uniref:Nucleotidyltransferase n=1 Tax=Aphanothece hegewaldii CCALA 016 TaxID=2107694 RepID=A0A2T1LQL6_9CHRO|nr:HepT-like ribonuclease domain-containing protein [Aphanothece hegewaldii]PSF28550.1 hypothetical protein C7H19_24585 [Aphanothece hegewaldii CCALA 016]
MQEAIIRIEKYSVRGKDIFLQDELIQTWILHHLQIIGEASRAMSGEFVTNHSEIEWLDIADFRNILVHEYFQVDLDIVWTIVERELPKLKSKIESLLSD